MSAVPSAHWVSPARPVGNATLVALVVLSLLASQRILLSGLAANLCMVPALLAVVAWRTPARRNALVLLALFISVDNGAGAYVETFPAARYAIYALAAAAIADTGRFSISRVIGCTVIAVVYTFLSLATDYFAVGQLVADAILLVTVAAAISVSPSQAARMDLMLLNRCLWAFMAGELFTLVFLSHSQYHYLNYHSLKSLVVLPSILLAARGRLLHFAPAFAITMIVLLSYGSRMIIVAYLLVLTGMGVRGIWRAPRRGPMTFRIVAFVAVLLGALSIVDQETLESYKFGWMLSQLTQVRVDAEVLQVIDPVRYREHELFFDRPWHKILRGEGLGAGLYDREGRLDFIAAFETAFSDKELASRIYFNFHDFWIDVGLRFGLLIVAAALAALGSLAFARDGALSAMGGLLFVLVLCAFFSTTGVLAIGLLILEVRCRRHDSALARCSAHGT